MESIRPVVMEAMPHDIKKLGQMRCNDTHVNIR